VRYTLPFLFCYIGMVVGSSLAVILSSDRTTNSSRVRCDPFLFIMFFGLLLIKQLIINKICVKLFTQHKLNTFHKESQPVFR